MEIQNLKFKIQRLLLFLFFSGVLLFCKCYTDINSTDEPLLLNDFSEIANHLEGAYQQQSQSALDTVFKAWQQIIPAYSNNQIKSFSDTVQQVYNIFRSFYSPTNLNRITGGQHENFETDFRYIVVQNTIRFAVVDTNPQFYYYAGVKTLERTITDFRPKIDEAVFPVLYLSVQADTMIYRYLFQSKGVPRQDHEQRVTFLRQAIQLTNHHWIPDYHKATMPIVSYIYMNENFTQALVNFRVFYQFGEALLEQSGEGWTLVNSKLTGIE